MTDYDQTLVDELAALASAHGAETVIAAAVTTLGAGDVTELYRRDDGDYGWRVRAGNGRDIAWNGEGHGDKAYTAGMARRVTGREPVDLT